MRKAFKDHCVESYRTQTFAWSTLVRFRTIQKHVFSGFVFAMVSGFAPQAALGHEGKKESLGFGDVASMLGIRAAGGSCRYNESSLTRAELRSATWPYVSRFETDWECLALMSNIRRDSRANCFPIPAAVLGGSVLGRTRIEGTISYVGLIRLPYRYDLSSDHKGDPIIELRVHFTGTLARDPQKIEHMARKLAVAAEIWTQNSPASDFSGRPVTFRFIVASTAKRAHFSVGLSQRCPRDPYLVSWGILCSPHFLAHEIGHMLGLDDEYNQFRKTLGHILGAETAWARDFRLRLDRFQCNLDSLMCSSKYDRSTPRLYHYYILLRRRFCSNTASGDLAFD